MKRDWIFKVFGNSTCPHLLGKYLTRTLLAREFNHQPLLNNYKSLTIYWSIVSTLFISSKLFEVLGASWGQLGAIALRDFLI